MKLLFFIAPQEDSSVTQHPLREALYNLSGIGSPSCPMKEQPDFDLGFLNATRDEMLRKGSLSERERDEILLMIAKNSCFTLIRLRQKNAFQRILDTALKKIGIL